MLIRAQTPCWQNTNYNNNTTPQLLAVSKHGSSTLSSPGTKEYPEIQEKSWAFETFDHEHLIFKHKRFFWTGMN